MEQSAEQVIKYSFYIVIILNIADECYITSAHYSTVNKQQDGVALNV